MTGNEFRFIGRCYGNPRRHLSYGEDGKRDKYKTYFTLVGKTSSDRTTFTPIVSSYKMSDLAYELCRNGNKVAVSGEVFTIERNNYKTGLIDVHIFFLATDIMLLEKVKRKELNEQSVADVISSMPIEER